jgi:hypothetical protein
MSMIALPDVETLMAGGLQAWLDSLRDERAAAKRKMIGIGCIGWSISLVIFLAGQAMDGGRIPLILACFLAVGTLGWIDKIYKQLLDRLKQGMNGALARALGIEYSVAAVRGAEFDVALEFGTLPDYDNESLQDYWRGKIGDTDFTLYEATLTEQRGSGKNRHTVEVFDGIIMRFAFAREFSGTTVVRRNRAVSFTLFGDAITGNGQKLERIKMVHPDFEDAFDVYGSDAVESHYLIHPQYCERLIALEREFAGEKLTALFHRGDVIITINADDMFESASLDPSEDRAGLTRTIAQFAEVARLITILNERPRG